MCTPGSDLNASGWEDPVKASSRVLPDTGRCSEPELLIRADVVWYYGALMGLGVRFHLSSARAGSHIGSGTTALLIAFV